MEDTSCGYQDGLLEDDFVREVVDDVDTSVVGSESRNR